MLCIICNKTTNNCLEYCKECYCECGINFYSYINLCFVCKKNTYCKSCKQNIIGETVCNNCYKICIWYENKLIKNNK